MKLPKRKFLIIFIILLNTFNVVVIYIFLQRRNANTKSIEQPQINQIKESKSKENQAKGSKENPSSSKYLVSTIDSTKSDSIKIFLPILGSSDKLSPVALRNLRTYRAKQRALAIKHPKSLYFNGDTMRKEIALTFDDGPDARVTPQVLKILAKYKVPASFFLVGNYVKNHPGVVKKIDKEGHLVLNHSTSHQSYMKKQKSWIKRDLMTTENAIFKVIGKRSAMFRPPYGDIDLNMIEEVQANGYKNIIWSYDTLDWTGASIDTIAQGIITKVRPGEIILMHSRQGVENTVKALPKIIQRLQQQGYQFVRLDKMLMVRAYK